MPLLKSDRETFADLSLDLRERYSWQLGVFRSLDFAVHVTALAVEPVSGLLAYGTSSGTIHIFGAPGVEVKLDLPEPDVGVKFLQISASTSKLACIDDQNQLHVWDLSTYGRPSYINSARFDPCSSLTTTAASSHVFIALQSGAVRTYDLLCMRKSPYALPNMWKLYQDKITVSGDPSFASPYSGVALDTIPHPRDLNQLFVVYTGGVVLADLTQRTTMHVYELVLPPGAPGGSGYSSQDILTHRRPDVTCMAIHPSGHFFVVGYSDGMFAFWAVEDEDQPLLVRTLDGADVNIVDYVQLEEHLSKAQGNSTSPLEPVFKVSWAGFSNSSDPRGGSTALVIMGGLDEHASPGLTVLSLPPFNPSEPPVAETNNPRLPAHFRNAMRNSVVPVNDFFYTAKAPCQDFLLIPRDNPHYSGAFDPYAILLLVDGPEGTRLVEAFEFPHPAFAADTNANLAPSGQQSSSVLDDLTSTLQDMKLSSGPEPISIPASLETGCHGPIGGRIIRLDREPYSHMTGVPTSTRSLSLKGGVAWSDETKLSELKLSKYQPPRVLLTWNSDLTVSMLDISASLLLGIRPDPVKYDFPGKMPWSNIDVNTTLMDPSVARRLNASRNQIAQVLFASGSMDCGVLLNSGTLVVYHYQPGRPDALPFRESPSSELLVLDHVPTSRKSSYWPRFLLLPRPSPATASAICDVGFVAVGYADGALTITDMRPPRIVLQEQAQKPRHSVALHLHQGHSKEGISSLIWTVCPLANDRTFRLRLISVRNSGLVQTYTFVQDGSGWKSTKEPTKSETSAGVIVQDGCFVLDAKSGIQWRADRQRLRLATEPAGEAHACFITVGHKGLRCNIDVNGERVGKTDWPDHAGTITDVQVVDKLGAQALVCLTDGHDALVYSIPNLELIQKLALPVKASLPISVDETGDFIAWQQDTTSRLIESGVYGTFFDSRRAMSLSEIEVMPAPPSIPSYPSPVSMGPPSLIGSWWTWSQSMSGTQLDTILGGPDRPIPTPADEAPEKKPSNPPSSSRSASSLAASTSGTQSNLYARLQNALGERGQMLNDLEDRFNSLEEGSRGMASQAKKLAAQQTAKSWFKFS